MSQMPLSLHLVIQILKLVKRQKGRAMITDLTTDPRSTEGEKISQHFQSLGDFDVVQTALTKDSQGEWLMITDIKPLGEQLFDVLSNDQVLEGVQSMIGTEVAPDQLRSILDVGSKLLGDLFKPNPEKKAARQEKRAKRKANREKNVGQEHETAIREAKQSLINYARTLIPQEHKALIRIPGTVSSDQLQVKTTSRQDIVEFIQKTYDQKSISVRIDHNPGLGLSEVGFFNNDESVYDMDINSLSTKVESEKLNVENNISKVLSDESSPIKQMIEAYELYLMRQVDEVLDDLKPNPAQYQTAQEQSEVLNVELPGDFEKNIEDPKPIPEQEEPPAALINNPLQLARLHSDSAHKGQDLLGFTQDVEAFAAIMTLKELTPPLAVALFGQWGSGKSFFMQKLVETVKELGENQGIVREGEAPEQHAEGESEKPFCEGVCQIQFNAWSYTDTNLWASLVSGIFEGLEEFITENKRVEIEKGKIEQELSEKLELSREQESKLARLKEEKQKAIETLTSERNTEAGNMDKAIKAVKEATLDQVMTKLKEAVKGSDAVKAVETGLAELQIDPTSISQWSPDNVLKEVTAWKTFGLAFFRMSRKQWLQLGGIAVLILALVLIPSVLKPELNLQGLSFLGISGSALVAIWEKARITLGKLNPVVTKVLDYKNEYEEKLSQLISEQERTVEANKLLIEKSQQEIVHINQQLDVVNQEINQLEYSLKNTLSQKALYSFILERSKSNDYERHLGIISTIRRDFETLSYLFVESLAEIAELEEKAKKLGEKPDELFRVQEKIKSLDRYKDFSKQFNKPLERIILYIDDLDRCPEERVVEVLEAVNLLMAFPLFVVVVGVDPRWVKNALIKKYYLQFTGHIKGGDKEVEELDVEVISASDYLEKIFQIPFHLKSPSDDSIKKMIAHLLGDTVVEIEEAPEEETKAEVETESPAEGPDTELPEGLEELIDDMPKEIDLPDGVQPPVPDATGFFVEPVDFDTAGPGASDFAGSPPESEALEEEQKTHTITPGTLKIHAVERAYMQSLSELIGNTPRTVKRFVNMYRIIRAHEGLSYTDDDDRKDLFGILFVLALRTGPYYEFFDDTLNLLFKDVSKPAWESLQEEQDTISDVEDPWGKLLTKLREIKELDLLRSIDPYEMAMHIEFVKRFSFKIPD